MRIAGGGDGPERHGEWVHDADLVGAHHHAGTQTPHNSAAATGCVEMVVASCGVYLLANLCCDMIGEIAESLRTVFTEFAPTHRSAEIHREDKYRTVAEVVTSFSGSAICLLAQSSWSKHDFPEPEDAMTLGL
jgi:hypothetical protein